MKERALKVAMVVAGLIFVAGAYPGTVFFFREPSVPMLMSIYVTMGVFLLLAVRDPAANRSLIAFAGWANVAHAGVMAVQEYLHVIRAQEWAGVIVFGVVGVMLIVMGPGKAKREMAVAAGVKPASAA